MKIDVLTLFPEVFSGALASSMLARAQERGILSVNVVNFREYARDRHRTVDDTAYGGGPGMVLKPEPLFLAVEDLIAKSGQDAKPDVVLLTPQGRRFTQTIAESWARDQSWLILLAGHYEGFDERIREHLVMDEISIGDFVLTGGELPALVVIDAVARLLPGVLGNELSAVEESFSDGLLDFPHYTRPENFRGWTVPEVLLSGHHERIAQWRRSEAILRTHQRRPELLRDASLSDEEREWIQKRDGEKA